MKKKNNSERNMKIKRQLISAGVYIALAVTVLVITSNSVKKIMNSTSGYEIPEFDTTPQKIVFPSLDKKDNTEKDAQNNESSQSGLLPDQKEITPGDIIVSDSPNDVSAQIDEPVTELPTENIPISGEPDDEEPLPENIVQDDISRFDSDVIPDARVKPASGYISREYSRDELIYTPTMNDFRTHDGIDITGDIGSPVVAFADGVIEDVYSDPFMGTTVVIRHSGGLVSCYSNLSENLPQNVRVGAVVTVGSTIGGIGESAIVESAEVPHVHFELYKDELCIDPEEYLG